MEAKSNHTSSTVRKVALSAALFASVAVAGGTPVNAASNGATAYTKVCIASGGTPFADFVDAPGCVLQGDRDAVNRWVARVNRVCTKVLDGLIYYRPYQGGDPNDSIIISGPFCVPRDPLG